MCNKNEEEAFHNFKRNAMAYKCMCIDEVEKVVITQPYKGKSAFMTRQFKNKKSLIISQLHGLKASQFN